MEDLGEIAVGWGDGPWARRAGPDGLRRATAESAVVRRAALGVGRERARPVTPRQQRRTARRTAPAPLRRPDGPNATGGRGPGHRSW